jgi:hypothetical protein
MLCFGYRQYMKIINLVKYFYILATSPKTYYKIFTHTHTHAHTHTHIYK